MVVRSLHRKVSGLLSRLFAPWPEIKAPAPISPGRVFAGIVRTTHEFVTLDVVDTGDGRRYAQLRVDGGPARLIRPGERVELETSRFGNVVRCYLDDWSFTADSAGVEPWQLDPVNETRPGGKWIEPRGGWMS